MPVEVIEQLLLRCQSNGEIFVEWARVPVTSTRHFLDKVTVTVIQCAQATVPPENLWVVAVSDLGLRDYRPDGVELAVLAEQVLPAQHRRR